MREIAFIVNEARGLEAKQTTTAMIAATLARGHHVHVVESGSLCCDEEDRILATMSYALEPGDSEPGEVVERLTKGARGVLDVAEVGVAWVRTNPARDARAWAHQNALTFLEMARDRSGVRVINDPSGLKKGSSKLYLQEFPEVVRPRTMIARDVDVIRGFIERVDGPCVIKPLKGTHGRDVFKIAHAGAENLRQILEIMTRTDYVIAQEFVPEAGEGDVRLLLVEGELLEVKGKVAAVHRRPGAADFRSNVSAGGTATRAVITETMREVIAKMTGVLRRDGIFLAGVDFIGSKVVEVNVFSPGGVTDAERFEGVSFMDALLERALV